MTTVLTDDDIFKKFSINPTLWDAEDRKIFLIFVRKMHAIGVDWQVTNKRNGEIGRFKFGRYAKTRFSKVLGWIKPDDPLGIIVSKNISFPQNENHELKLGKGSPNRIKDEKSANKIADELQRALGLINSSSPDRSIFGWPDSGLAVQESEKEEEEEEEEEEEGVLEIYYGPPGTGKTKRLREILKDYDCGENESTERYPSRCKFVTFHQSYGYEEFVEGLRPVLLEVGESGDKPVHYKIQSGVFKMLCAEAARDEKQRYAIVIDEINRGNISKIFGELITLIEPDKRGLKVTLPYSGELFSVPPNVDIYGSMNTSDRSLALLDTALRRRFNFIPIMPDPSTLRNIDVITIDKQPTNIKLESILSKINERIEVLYDRDHVIGHAYFLSGRKSNSPIMLNELAEIFAKKLIPLLQEYFFDDWQKIRLVLADNSCEIEKYQFIIKKEINTEILFGSEATEGLNGIASATYALNSRALMEAGAYIKIYAPLVNPVGPIDA